MDAQEISKQANRGELRAIQLSQEAVPSLADLRIGRLFYEGLERAAARGGIDGDEAQRTRMAFDRAFGDIEGDERLSQVGYDVRTGQGRVAGQYALPDVANRAALWALADGKRPNLGLDLEATAQLAGLFGQGPLGHSVAADAQSNPTATMRYAITEVDPRQEYSTLADAMWAFPSDSQAILKGVSLVMTDGSGKGDHVLVGHDWYNDGSDHRYEYGSPEVKRFHKAVEKARGYSPRGPESRRRGGNFEEIETQATAAALAEYALATERANRQELRAIQQAEPAAPRVADLKIGELFYEGLKRIGANGGARGSEALKTIKAFDNAYAGIRDPEKMRLIGLDVRTGQGRMMRGGYTLLDVGNRAALWALSDAHRSDLGINPVARNPVTPASSPVLGLVDGVDVARTGHGFVVRFDYNEPLARHLRAAVPDAKFDHDAKGYAVPADKASALGETITAMRLEFAGQQRERSEVREALSWMEKPPALQDANTRDGRETSGKIVAETDRFAAQTAGAGRVLLHHKASLQRENVERGDRMFHRHEAVTIRYDKGRGDVQPMKERRVEEGKNRGLER